MENFAFHQFVRQIYAVHPELQEHEELVRSFIADALVDQKSLVIDDHVLSLLREYIDKRISLQQVGDQLLPEKSMLFASEQMVSTVDRKDRIDIKGHISTDTTDVVSDVVVTLKDTVLTQHTNNNATHNASTKLSSQFSFFSFLIGVVCGALLTVCGIIIYAFSQELFIR